MPAEEEEGRADAGQLPTEDVPQADRPEKVIEYAILVSQGQRVTPETLGLQPRHINYYACAARIVGFLDDRGEVTDLARALHELDADSQIERMAHGLAQSDVYRRWVEWTGVDPPDDLTTLGEFLSTQTALSPSTAKRRAGTLRRWLRVLGCHLGMSPAVERPLKQPAATGDGNTREAEPLMTRVELLQAILGMLERLAAHDVEAADRWRAEIEATPLGELSNASLERISEAVAALEANTADEGASHLERDYGIFLDAIPQGRRLVDDVESLARSGDFDELLRNAEQVFVQRLGFTAAPLDESARSNRADFQRIVRVARFGDVEVVCVGLTHVTWFAQFYDHIFRFHPYAIILALEPEATALRVVYRPSPSASPQYRCLTGRQMKYAPNDNLVVWAWRLQAMRPEFGESALTLHRRVARALSLPPEDVGRRWTSAPLDPSRPLPGISWAEAPRRAFESFIQIGVEPDERRRWGLEAVLRDRFPIFSRHARVRVDYLGYEVGDNPPSVEDCVRSGSTRHRRVNLDIEIVAVNTRRRVCLPCTLPEPDDQGRFVFEGVVHLFTAQVVRDGLLEGFTVDDDDPATEDEADDADDADEADDADAGDIVDGEDTPFELDEDDRGPRGSSIASILNPRVFFECAVTRKLARLNGKIRNLIHEHEKLDIGRIIRGFWRYDRWSDAVSLVSISVLRQFLAADGSGASVVRAANWQAAAIPPSWACVDASSQDVGVFMPIVGARLHPTGSLAIPVRDGKRVRLRLSSESALDVNPRAGVDTPRCGPPAWWISPPLANFAHRPVGAIEDPGLAGRSHTLHAMVARIESEDGRRRAWTVEGGQVPHRERIVLERRVPSHFADDENAPRLLVSAPCWVSAGDAWLEIGSTTWSVEEAEGPSPEEELALEILKRAEAEAVADVVPKALHRVDTVPTGVAGIVKRAEVEAVKGPFGVTVAYNAFIVIERSTTPGVTLVDGQGHVYPVVGTWSRADLPHDEDGTRHVDFVIE